MHAGVEFPPKNSMAVLSGCYTCKIGSGYTSLQLSSCQGGACRATKLRPEEHDLKREVA